MKGKATCANTDIIDDRHAKGQEKSLRQAQSMGSLMLRQNYRGNALMKQIKRRTSELQNLSFSQALHRASPQRKIHEGSRHTIFYQSIDCRGHRL